MPRTVSIPMGGGDIEIEYPDQVTWGTIQSDLKRRSTVAKEVAGQVYDSMHPLDKAALWTIPIPLVGDITGLIADARMYIQEPENRTALNAGLTMLGAVPLIPAASTVNKVVDATRAKKGIEAWHGSPHKFDKFSMGQIGTGEGAQAYGHGLYFADAKDVAKGFRDVNAYRGFDMDSEAASRGLELIPSTRAEIFRQVRANPDASPQDIAKRIGYANAPARDIDQDALADLVGSYQENAKGSLYRTQLNVDPDDLLDWDAPLSEQSEKVQKALRPYINDGGIADPDLQRRIDILEGKLAKDPSLEEAYRPRITKLKGEQSPSTSITGQQVISDLFPDQQTASQNLKEAGIPGIKYLDGDPRGLWELSTPDTTSAGDWMVKNSDKPLSSGMHFDNEADALAELARRQEGTRNYVIFDDSLIDILERGKAEYAAFDPAASTVKSVSKGLDKSQAARMRRAADQGHSVAKGETWYHGTPYTGEMTEFDPSMLGSNAGGADSSLGFYVSRREATANAYLDEYPEIIPENFKKKFGISLEDAEKRVKQAKQELVDLGVDPDSFPYEFESDAIEQKYRALKNMERNTNPYHWENATNGKDMLRSVKDGQVLPLSIRGDMKEYDWGGEAWDSAKQKAQALQAMDEGYDGVVFKNIQDSGWFGGAGSDDVALVFDPTNIRSVNAAFDPAKKDSANLLASIVGGGILTGAVANEKRKAKDDESL